MDKINVSRKLQEMAKKMQAGDALTYDEVDYFCELTNRNTFRYEDRYSFTSSIGGKGGKDTIILNILDGNGKLVYESDQSKVKPTNDGINK